MNLLIVEGHDGVRRGLATALGRAPAVSVLGAAAHLSEALPLIARQAPDVVLFEPRTTAGAPLAALQRLVGAGRPVVVLTSSLLDGEGEAFLRAGAAAVALKGDHTAALLATLERVHGAVLH
jgi:DNA-binding NarL/FixJ family response regulator